MPCSEDIHLCCGFCGVILYMITHCTCCRKPPKPKKEYSVICIGLSKAGKTTMLSVLCNETTDGIVPTTGFIIKPCTFRDCILNVKEIGGGEKQRQFWRHYYRDAQAVVFVIDSSSDEVQMETAKAALHDAVSHPDLQGLPCLILGNYQDVPGARNSVQLSDYLDVEALSQNRPVQLSVCSTLTEPDTVRQSFDSFIERHLHNPSGPS